MAELFGFSITRKRKNPRIQNKALLHHKRMTEHKPSPLVVILVSTLIWKVLLENEQELIRRYREIALHPECDMAIEDIVNEAIVANELKDAVKLDLSKRRVRCRN